MEHYGVQMHKEQDQSINTTGFLRVLINLHLSQRPHPHGLSLQPGNTHCTHTAGGSGSHKPLLILISNSEAPPFQRWLQLLWPCAEKWR